MRSPALFLVALLMGARAAAAPLTVAVPRLGGSGIDDRQLGIYTEQLAQGLVEGGAKVVSSADIEAAIGLERQKQLAGCGDDASCVAEIGSALGVDVLAVGEVARLDTGRFQLSVRLVASGTSRRVASLSERVDTDDAALDALSRAGERLAAEASVALGKPLLRSSAGRRWAWLPLAAGALAAGAGTLFPVRTEDECTALRAANDVVGAKTHADAGQSAQTATWVAFGAAAALFATSAALFFSGDAAPVAVVTPDGAAFGVAGTF